jgi:hypothetical protein
MDLSGLAILKKKLITASEFVPVWEYFMTHFGENREFMLLGEPVQSPIIEASVAQAAQGIFKMPVSAAKLRLIRLPAHRFIHGPVSLFGKFGNVFYFEDVGVGLLTIVLKMDGSDNRLARFTTQTLPAKDVPRQ